MLPYVKMMLRLKIIAEDQSQLGISKGHGAKKLKAALVVIPESVKSVQGKSGSKNGRVALKPSVQLDDQIDAGSARASHPQKVINSVVDWIRRSKGMDSNPQRYYKSLCMMWTSGELDWARNHPIPSQSQVYDWLIGRAQALKQPVDGLGHLRVYNAR